MKLSFKTILPIILISALLILLTGCTVPDESPGYTPGAISGTIARPEVCCGEPSESYLVGAMPSLPISVMSWTSVTLRIRLIGMPGRMSKSY